MKIGQKMINANYGMTALVKYESFLIRIKKKLVKDMVRQRIKIYKNIYITR